ncbi:MAG TPA: transglutaminase family protein, partial [Tepidisphaeraceae bacterium]|nr:transglutaminase family protein [Tepidisphaeraceae bacterium]
EMYQHRLSFDLAIGPAAVESSYFDWLGNTVHAFTVNGFHNAIKIVAQSVLEVDRKHVDLTDASDPFPLAPPSDYTLVDYLNFGGPIVDCPELRALVDSLEIKSGMPIGEIASRMVNAVHDRFVYEQGVTHVASPITDLLAHGKGVCQDFTHLFIGMARLLGIPARYVSGLIHPQVEALRGTTQTHAWCELLFPTHGWVGLDPTNRRQVGNNFVTIAVGRDYRDVPPNKGVFRGGANELMNVTVNSHQLESVPEELAAERVSAIGVPVYPGWGRDRRILSDALQAAQQQQQ